MASARRSAVSCGKAVSSGAKCTWTWSASEALTFGRSVAIGPPSRTSERAIRAMGATSSCRRSPASTKRSMRASVVPLADVGDLEPCAVAVEEDGGFARMF